MFDARDGALEAWKAEQPIGSALHLRVERGERLDTNKEREQAASDFRFHGGGQMFSGWIKSKSTDPSRTDAFHVRVMNKIGDEKKMYSDRSIFRRDFVLLMVEVEGERLTLTVVVFDHDFERLSFGGE